VFLSSSQVFDGETPHARRGRADRAQERIRRPEARRRAGIERQKLPAAVLRVTKVLADRPVGVFKGWFEALAKGQPVQAATNMALSPVMVGDVAEAAERLAAGAIAASGTLGSSDDIGYFDAARADGRDRHLPAPWCRARS
jgi:uncharacterized protein YbjT (DUF2867 family)